MRRADPPAVPQLAVGIEVPEHLVKEAFKLQDPKAHAIGLLAVIAFYYLLRVGEYTKPRLFAVINGRRVQATRTVQFTVGSVGFFKNNRELPRESPLETLLSADHAVLRITNQKNGRMGDVITHESNPDNPFGPTQCLAHRVHHILSNGGTSSTLLCDYFTADGLWHSVTPDHLRFSLRLAIKQLNLTTNGGLDPRDIGVHSLRAGGAMAMKMHGADDTTIMKQGRWTSMTFLQYIHNQLAVFSKDLSRQMSTPLPFLNVANFKQ